MGHVTHSLLKTQHPQSLHNINAQLLATGHWEGELVHTRRDGALVTVASSWTLQRDESNSPVSVIEMNYDITARKESEEAIRNSAEERLSSAFEQCGHRHGTMVSTDAVRDELRRAFRTYGSR